MTRDQALRKIKKLLAMAGSSNANEAATAMRQAQALMREYQLSEHEAAGVQENVHLGRGKDARVGLTHLAQLVADLYGATLYMKQVYVKRSIRRAYAFVSDKPGTVEICGYAMAVLVRQLQRDCNWHLSRVKKAKNRAARGDIFAQAWVHGLRIALDIQSQELAPQSAAVVAYMEGLALGKATIKARTSNAVSINDRHAGLEAGKKAQLNKGVKQSRAALEHMQ